MGDFLDWLPINDDVEAEFCDYWAGELRAAVVKAAAFAGSPAWPSPSCPARRPTMAASGSPSPTGPTWSRSPSGSVCWSGCSGAAKRFGAALAGSQPWREPARCGEREATARFFGQWACSPPWPASPPWMAHEITAVATGGGPAALFHRRLRSPLWAACFPSAAAFFSLPVWAGVVGRPSRRDAIRKYLLEPVRLALGPPQSQPRSAP